MNYKTAQQALQFLQRTQLSGHEVPAFLTVVRALEKYAMQQDVANAQKRFDEAVDRRDMPSGAQAPSLGHAYGEGNG